MSTKSAARRERLEQRLFAALAAGDKSNVIARLARIDKVVRMGENAQLKYTNFQTENFWSSTRTGASYQTIRHDGRVKLEEEANWTSSTKILEGVVEGASWAYKVNEEVAMNGRGVHHGPLYVWPGVDIPGLKKALGKEAFGTEDLQYWDALADAKAAKRWIRARYGEPQITGESVFFPVPGRRTAGGDSDGERVRFDDFGSAAAGLPRRGYLVSNLIRLHGAGILKGMTAPLDELLVALKSRKGAREYLEKYFQIVKKEGKIEKIVLPGFEEKKFYGGYQCGDILVQNYLVVALVFKAGFLEG